MSDAYLSAKQKEHANLIESVDVRVRNVRRFCILFKPSVDTRVVIIHDSCGPTITEPGFDCIVASTETLRGCIYVNKVRKEGISAKHCTDSAIERNNSLINKHTEMEALSHVTFSLIVFFFYFLSLSFFLSFFGTNL